MKNRKALFNRLAYSLGLALLGLSQFAVAKNVGAIAQDMSNQVNMLGVAAQGFFGLCGLVLIGMSVFIFIKHNKTDGQGAKLSTGFIYLIGGAALLYMASLVQTTGDSIWGEGGADRSRVQITH